MKHMIRVHAGVCLLEARDAALLKELELACAIEDLILARCSECAVVVAPEAVETLRQRLAARGYPPRVMA